MGWIGFAGGFEDVAAGKDHQVRLTVTGAVQVNENRLGGELSFSMEVAQAMVEVEAELYPKKGL